MKTRQQRYNEFQRNRHPKAKAVHNINEPPRQINGEPTELFRFMLRKNYGRRMAGDKSKS